MARKTKNNHVPAKEVIDFSEFPMMADMSEKDLVDQLWALGNLEWKLDSAQKELYKFFLDSDEKTTVIALNRQGGKSYLMTIIALQYCFQNANVQVKYCCGNAKAALKATRSNFLQLLQECPKEIRPQWDRTLGCYKFKNNSLFYFEGIDSGKSDDLRGTPANLIIIDEAGFINDLEYALGSVLIPMTTTTKGRILIISTPPKTKDHDFKKIVDKAVENKSYFEMDVYTYIDKIKNDPPFFRNRITLSEIEKIKKTMTENQFRREFLIKYEVEEDSVVVPEFSSKKIEIIKEHQRPPNCKNYVAMDLGLIDLTAVVFGYYDWKNDKVVIEDELQVDGKKLTGKYLGENITRIENKLWSVNGDAGFKIEPEKRVCDTNEQIARVDLFRNFGLKFVSAQKDDKAAAIDLLRRLIITDRLIIHPRCTNIIYHLENATWNKSRTSFTRSARAYHFDFVDAMLYFIRAVKYKDRPETVKDRDDRVHYIGEQGKPVSKTAEALKGLLIRNWRKSSNKL